MEKGLTVFQNIRGFQLVIGNEDTQKWQLIGEMPLVPPLSRC
jgi:hypothetical protein